MIDLKEYLKLLYADASKRREDCLNPVEQQYFAGKCKAYEEIQGQLLKDEKEETIEDIDPTARHICSLENALERQNEQMQSLALV